MRPILIQAFGLQAASAPVFAGLAALVAFLYFQSRRSDLGCSEEDFWGLIGALAFGVFAGSIGGYALISRAGNWNLELWSGRFAIPGGTFLGGMPGAVLAAAAYCRLRRLPFLPIADVLAAAAPLGLIVMRAGCLLNGCCHGLPTGADWGIQFTKRCAVPWTMRGINLHPTQIYEAVGAALIFLVVVGVVRPRIKSGALRPGDGLWISALLYGVLRFVVDFYRAPDPSVFPTPLMSLAQWGCAAMIGAAAVRFLRPRR